MPRVHGDNVASLEAAAAAKAIAEVKSATASNERKAKAIRDIKGGVESLVRIVDLLL